MEESSVAILAQASHLHSSIPYSHSYLLQDHQGNMSAFMRRQMGSSPVMSTMSSGGYGTGYGTSYGTGYGTTMMSSPQYMQQAPVQTMAAPQYMPQARVQTMAAPQMMVQQAPTMMRGASFGTNMIRGASFGTNMIRGASFGTSRARAW